MLSKSDKDWLQENFALKSDLKSELKPIKKDISDLKTDMKTVKGDISNIKLKVNEFAETATDVLGNILNWTDDIHKSLVREKLPERVKKLEHLFKSS